MLRFSMSLPTAAQIQELREALFQAVNDADNKKLSVAFRLPIDRVFT